VNKRKSDNRKPGEKKGSFRSWSPETWQHSSQRKKKKTSKKNSGPVLLAKKHDKPAPGQLKKENPVKDPTGKRPTTENGQVSKKSGQTTTGNPKKLKTAGAQPCGRKR